MSPLPMGEGAMGCSLSCPKRFLVKGDAMNLGKKIRHMRQMRGLTAVALAKYARVTPGFINQLEYSQTVPSLQTLQRVADVLARIIHQPKKTDWGRCVVVQDDSQ